MGLSTLLAIAALAGAELASAEPAEIVEAQPEFRHPPKYPASCPTGSPDGIDAPETVVVSFDVAKNGETENVRIVEASNPCFEEAVIAAVRNWTYTPRRENGRRVPQTGLTTTFTFKLNRTTQTEDFDARALERTPPRYPRRCMHKAGALERVLVQFDVTAQGTTDNIRVVESTLDCLNTPAIKSVESWLYRPKVVDGTAVRREGVQTIITFQLSGYSPGPEYKMRSSFKRKLNKVRRTLKKTGDPQEALALLDEIEREYGDDFSRAELASFHFLRAGVRIDADDYAGALDDLYVVRDTGMTSSEAGEITYRMIAQLEEALQLSGAKAPTDETDEKGDTKESAVE